MKIKTITCHNVYNYGASLQAYALQHYCESLGCEYQIIDYNPDYLSGRYKLTAVTNDHYNKPLISLFYIVAKCPKRLLEWPRKKIFDRFTKEYLNLTTQGYKSCEEIAADCPFANLYIAGSDQIWNTLFRNGRDPAFYLDFLDANHQSRKISYAASFATDKIYNDAESFVASKLKKLDAIAVRESGALKLLYDLGRTDGVLVCDPVFLLSADEWLKIVNIDSQKKDYIFVYDCERSNKIREIALELKRRTGLPIYTVYHTKGRYADKDYLQSGPKEFLTLLFRSRYVVTNSFHAMAFSIIFQKDFYLVNRKMAVNSRTNDFLSYLDLSERLIDSPSQLTIKPIDYLKIKLRQEKIVMVSKNYLKEQISKCK